MKKFQCINCGEILESEEKCTCSACGYRMYEAPFERVQILYEEIRGYLLSCLDFDFKSDWFLVIRHEKGKTFLLSDDTNRFPAYEKIYDYATKVNKTEEFLKRLEQSVKHLKDYCEETYNNEYLIDFGPSEEEFLLKDEYISSVLDIASVDLNVSNTEISEASMKYSETPDEEISSEVKCLADNITELYEKIKRFINSNRLYGEFYRKNSMPGIKIKDDADYRDLIIKQTESIQKVIKKKYVIDILSDGTDEISEMLNCLWKSICLLMSIPVLTVKKKYSIDDKIFDGDDEFIKYLHKYVADRYSSVRNKISSDEFLSELSEKQLFKIYDSLIKSDTTGYFTVNASSLIPKGNSEEKLHTLIGLEPVKRSIKKIKAYSIANKNSSDFNLHMCFYGNPGTGKTEVARIIAGILNENGILPTDKMVEVDRRGLVAEYVGQTAEKTMRAVESAMGGVLFIDEAYSLSVEGSNGDYGKEAISTLIKAMEDYRGKFCVILAGYKNEMTDMLKVNPGFQSRIQFTLDFPNYSRDELRQISGMMLIQKKYKVSEAAAEKMLDITDIQRKNENFANAREMRNIIEQVIMCQNLRVCDPENRDIELTDVNQYIRDAGISLPLSDDSPKSRVLSGEDELEQLIGLETVKRMVRKIKAYAKRNHSSSDFNLHMCFTGNPGTGKTEVARILSRILYDAEVLSDSKLIETESSGLIGKFVGETAPKTIAKVRDALGGVLFIDEAYALTEANGEKSSFGDEAVSALIKEMEDKRGKVCVILAGYQEEMKQMISSNPGFASRIQFTLNFPDYTSDELREIAADFLKKKGYTANTSAMDKIMEIAEYFRNQPNFANARTVRNIVDQVIMNQNLRAEDDEDDYTVILSDVEDYIADEGIDLNDAGGPRKIGFI